MRLGEPELLFEGRFVQSSDTGSSFEVSRDGRRFLLARREADIRSAAALVLVQDWFAEVSRLTAPHVRGGAPTRSGVASGWTGDRAWGSR